MARGTLHLIDPTRNKAADPGVREAFEKQQVPEALGRHALAAKDFQADPDLLLAINAALAVGAPLLLTGEPGTGKTQVAYWLAYHLGLEPLDERLIVVPVSSTTTKDDLLYTFDTVAYFHAAHDPDRKGQPINKADYVRPGALWKAFLAERSIVLVDEIDKASRDFPNDLLHVLDQHHFFVTETGKKVERLDGRPPPVVIITSNSERRLPEPFLRRCIFHALAFNEETVRRAVEARVKDFPKLDKETRAVAIDRFLEIRGRKLRKPPSTGELLVWLTILSALGIDAETLKRASRKELPARSALIKDQDDMAQL